MDIMELGAIEDFVGAIAVVGSLIYGGLQIQQGNATARAEAQQTLLFGAHHYNFELARGVAGLLAAAMLFPAAVRWQTSLIPPHVGDYVDEFLATNRDSLAPAWERFPYLAEVTDSKGGS